MQAHTRVERDVAILRLLAHDLAVHLAFGRHVDDEVALDERLAAEAMILLERPAPFAELLLRLAHGGQVLRTRVNRVLAEIADRADDPAAAAKAAPAAHRIDIHTDTARRVEQRRAVREHAPASRRQKYDLCVSFSQ